jgi:hypothetical protein
VILALTFQSVTSNAQELTLVDEATTGLSEIRIDLYDGRYGRGIPRPRPVLAQAEVGVAEESRVKSGLDMNITTCGLLRLHNLRGFIWLLCHSAGKRTKRRNSALLRQQRSDLDED